MRKLNNIIGLLGPAVTVVLAGYAGCSAEWAIILFSASVGLSAFTIPGAKSRFDFHLPAFYRSQDRFEQGPKYSCLLQIF